MHRATKSPAPDTRTLEFEDQVWPCKRSPQPTPEKNEMEKTFRVIDLFAGVGGLSHGFAHLSEFDLIAANEILPPMAEAYRLNHPKVKMYEGDIADFGLPALRKDFGSKVSHIDVVVGGPPCQGYSTVGKRLLDDPRANLFQQYFRILHEFKPQVFIYENVKGLLSMHNGELISTIVDLFSTLGYNVQFKILNAVDFGVPQMRERVIIVGTRGKIDFKYPKSTHRDPTNSAGMFEDSRLPWLTLREAIGDLPFIKSGGKSTKYRSAEQNEFQELMRLDAPVELMDHNAPTHNSSLIELMNHLPDGGTPMDLPQRLKPTSGFKNTYCRLWWDKPCPTITRNLGTPSSSRCIHPKVSRGLTTREGARIQCFPDSYKFFGSRTDKNLQIGNAVPTFLSAAVAKSVLSALIPGSN